MNSERDWRLTDVTSSKNHGKESLAMMNTCLFRITEEVAEGQIHHQEQSF